MGNPVVHFEIGGRDAVRTRAFYSELFDWDVRAIPAGTGSSTPDRRLASAAA